jgi:hypothetical protein
VAAPAKSDTHSVSAWPADWSQLLSGLVATFVGALFAVSTAIPLDRKRQRWELKRQRIASVEQTNEKLDLLERELGWNREELVAILTDLSERFRTDRAPLTDAWSAVGIEAMKIGGLSAIQVSRAYSLLRRCQRVLDDYAKDLAQGGPSALMARELTFSRVREVIGETQVAVSQAHDAVKKN